MDRSAKYFSAQRPSLPSVTGPKAGVLPKQQWTQQLLILSAKHAVVCPMEDTFQPARAHHPAQPYGKVAMPKPHSSCQTLRVLQHVRHKQHCHCCLWLICVCAGIVARVAPSGLAWAGPGGGYFIKRYPPRAAGTAVAMPARSLCMTKFYMSLCTLVSVVCLRLLPLSPCHAVGARVSCL